MRKYEKQKLKNYSGYLILSTAISARDPLCARQSRTGKKTTWTCTRGTESFRTLLLWTRVGRKWPCIVAFFLLSLRWPTLERQQGVGLRCATCLSRAHYKQEMLLHLQLLRSGVLVAAI